MAWGPASPVHKDIIDPHDTACRSARGARGQYTTIHTKAVPKQHCRMSYCL
jgi:hypothetical protein